MSAILGPHGGRVLSASGMTQVLAKDEFTDADNTSLSDHISETGHVWTEHNGSFEIIGDVVKNVSDNGGWAHASIDLSAYLSSIREVRLRCKGGSLTTVYGITLRDSGFWENLIWCDIVATVSGLSLKIATYVAGAYSVRASKLVSGDFRNTNFNEIVVRDTGNTVTIDASSLEPSAMITWSNATGVLSANKNVGVYLETGFGLFEADDLYVKV